MSENWPVIVAALQVVALIVQISMLFLTSSYYRRAAKLTAEARELHDRMTARGF